MDEHTGHGEEGWPAADRNDDRNTWTAGQPQGDGPMSGAPRSGRHAAPRHAARPAYPQSPVPVQPAPAQPSARYSAGSARHAAARPAMPAGPVPANPMPPAPMPVAPAAHGGPMPSDPYAAWSQPQPAYSAYPGPIQPTPVATPARAFPYQPYPPVPPAGAYAPAPAGAYPVPPVAAPKALAKPLRFFPAVNLRTARKAFNRTGWALLVFLAATMVGAVILGVIAEIVSPGITNKSGSSINMGLSSLAQYGIGVPLCLLVFRSAPSHPPRPGRDDPGSAFGPGRWLAIFLMGFPIMYGGNLLGQLVSNLLSMGKYSNILDDAMSTGSSEFVLLDFTVESMVAVILAPCFEELIFRKMLIDRLRVYGEKIAILMSGLLFCLMHTNTYQTFYTFGWGLLWAYIYTRTGKVQYTIAMHAATNLMGGVVGPLLMSGLDFSAFDNLNTDDSAAVMDALARSGPALAVFGVYLLVILGLIIAGLVLLIRKRREFFTRPAGLDLAPGNRLRVVLGNPGMVAFIVVTTIWTLGAPIAAAFS
ncbi:CPBP family intramembrane glutamic endopeptidase [Bifidobacterium catulorum]|nr:CPBP family intramembrane glutamic endopeptidase [Bifidobacterium catulorum]